MFASPPQWPVVIDDHYLIQTKSIHFRGGETTHDRRGIQGGGGAAIIAIKILEIINHLSQIIGQQHCSFNFLCKYNHICMMGIITHCFSIGVKKHYGFVDRDYYFTNCRYNHHLDYHTFNHT